MSTRSQKDDSQLDALTSAGCERIWTDTASGKLARRPEWDKYLDYLRAGDELVVTRLSRMARSVRHLTETAALLADRGVDLVVRKQGIDTTTPAGRFLFHVIGAMDEMLADLISEGTLEDWKPPAPVVAPGGPPGVSFPDFRVCRGVRGGYGWGSLSDGWAAQPGRQGQGGDRENSLPSLVLPQRTPFLVYHSQCLSTGRVPPGARQPSGRG